MRELFERLQRTKMILTGLLLVVAGIVLLVVSRNVSGDNSGLVELIPWGELGGILIGAGLLGIWIEPSDIAVPRAQLLVRHSLELDSDVAGLFTVAEFKGLEADHVAVVWQPGSSSTPVVDLYVALSRARISAAASIPESGVPLLPEDMRRRLALSGPRPKHDPGHVEGWAGETYPL